jgi:hypothetical protein
MKIRCSCVDVLLRLPWVQLGVFFGCSPLSCNYDTYIMYVIVVVIRLSRLVPLSSLVL